MQDNNVLIIAEAGVNHNGDKERAFALVDVAVEAGANAVKFQTFTANNLVTKSAQKAKYQEKSTPTDESQYDMLKRLELSHEDHIDIASYCKKKGIAFLSTAFDECSLNFLSNNIDMMYYKIPSGEITNGPLLLSFARLNKPLILSTGMSTLSEIEEALSVIAFGLVGGDAPCTENFRKAYVSDEGQAILKNHVSLLHCTSLYPTPYDCVNLHAMQTLKHAFGLPIGYSDHTQGIAISIAATAMGAKIIEKHFTLDKSLPGPDHSSSLDPIELKDMVSGIRQVQAAMGDGIKRPFQEELDIQTVVRKSLFASADINRGQQISARDIDILRPGTGLSPMRYWEHIGRQCRSEIKKGDSLEA